MLATAASTYKVEHRCRHIVCSVRKLPKIFADSWLMSFASLFIYMTFLQVNSIDDKILGLNELLNHLIVTQKQYFGQTRILMSQKMKQKGAMHLMTMYISFSSCGQIIPFQRLKKTLDLKQPIYLSPQYDLDTCCRYL